VQGGTARTVVTARTGALGGGGVLVTAVVPAEHPATTATIPMTQPTVPNCLDAIATTPVPSSTPGSPERP
jgi:hypothetical protein